MDEERKTRRNGDPMFIHIPKEEMDRMLGRKPAAEEKDDRKE